MLTYQTIRTGERVAVWDKHGRVDFVSGPKRLLLWGKTVDHLERYAAGASEYLVITFKDGHAEHLRGPAAVWFHPVEHESIAVEPAVELDANEALVVYRRGDDGAISRRVVRGPELFVPAANEWLHEFSWHGSTRPDSPKKTPHALKFRKLRVIPDQMYFDVDEVRTADDALITVKLMIFFELADIEVMLQQTHDPVADFINALTADVIDFAATLPFEHFKEQTDRLNALDTYPQLSTRATRIGYRVNKVVYRGYHANPKLQAMHDNAIETRTRLRLESETENQAEEVADMKLQRESQRIAQRQQMEQSELDHKARIKQRSHEQELLLQRSQADAKLLLEQQQAEQKLRFEQQQAAQKLQLEQSQAEQKLQHELTVTKHRMEQEQAKVEQKLAEKRKANEIALEHRRALHQERLAALKAMRDMEVDLTRYLVSRHQHPDRIFRIDGNGNGAALHLHQ